MCMRSGCACACSLDVHGHAHWMLHACSLDAPCVLTGCSMRAHWMLHACSLDAPCVLTGCSIVLTGWLYVLVEPMHTVSCICMCMHTQPHAHVCAHACIHMASLTFAAISQSTFAACMHIHTYIHAIGKDCTCMLRDDTTTQPAHITTCTFSALGTCPYQRPCTHGMQYSMPSPSLPSCTVRSSLI